MSAEVIRFPTPRRQRGHFHTGWTALVGWALAILGVIGMLGSLSVLYVGLRMLGRL